MFTFILKSINPGLVKTEIFEVSGLTKEDSDNMFHHSPHLLPSDISNAVQYLLGLPEGINITELTIKPTGEPF